MGQRDEDFGLRYVQPAALALKPGTRVYVEGRCGPTIPYGLAFVVQDVTKDAIAIEYGGWLGDSYYRPQRVRVHRHHTPTPIPFNSAFDFKASERPPRAIALLDGRSRAVAHWNSG